MYNSYMYVYEGFFQEATSGSCAMVIIKSDDYEKLLCRFIRKIYFPIFLDWNWNAHLGTNGAIDRTHTHKKKHWYEKKLVLYIDTLFDVNEWVRTSDLDFDFGKPIKLSVSFSPRGLLVIST
jgi:hypothetical protein